MPEKIKVFALGGLDENGKNITIVEINEDIYVIDAGIKYPDKRVPGVDCIIPDFSYLKENASRVKAYIISHAHNDQMGALPYLYRRIPAPIYCSKLTASLIKSKTLSYGLKPIDYDFHIITGGSEIINGREFIFITMTHSIPGTFAVAIDTSEGYIVYSSDFIIDFGANIENRMDFTMLSSLPLKKQVLLLLAESCDSDKPGHTSPNHRLTKHISRLFTESKGRTFIAVYSQNLFNLREILDLAVKTNKKIIFLTDDAKRIFGEDIEHTDFDLPYANRTTLNEINRIREQDLLVIIDGEGEDVFNNLIKLAQGGYSNITFNENDTFILACPSVPGTETAAIDAVDAIYKTGANVLSLTRKDIYSMHAREEDIKMLKHKVDMGASFIITQLFFNNEYFYMFRERCEKAGINVPIVAGIMPIINYSQIERFQVMCSSHIPSELIKSMEGKSEEDIAKIGIDYAVNQCEDLVANGTAGLHFYTLNRSTATKKILDKLHFL